MKINNTEFNEKYKVYLEDGFYGLAFSNDKVTEYLDKIFAEIIIIYPDFQYSQIKTKFNTVVMYTNLPYSINSLIEDKINNLLGRLG